MGAVGVIGRERATDGCVREGGREGGGVGAVGAIGRERATDGCVREGGREWAGRVQRCDGSPHRVLLLGNLLDPPSRLHWHHLRVSQQSFNPTFPPRV